MATTSLGRLTLDLAVRLSDFTDGLTQAERQARDSASNISDSVSELRDNIADDIGRISGSFAGMAIGGIAVAAGAMAAMAIETAKADVQLGIMAGTANTGLKSFQVLTHAAAGFGVEQEALAAILADTQEKLGEFSATGGGGAADFFEALQNNTAMTDEEIRNLGKTLQGKDGVGAIQYLKDELDALGATSQEQRFIMESLAGDLGNLMPLFANGGDVLNRYGQELEDAGVIKSQDAIDQSRILAAETQAIQTKFEGLKTQLVTDMIPALGVLATHFTDSTDKGSDFRDEVTDIGKAVNVTAALLVGLAAGVGIFSSVMQQFSLQAGSLGRTVTDFYDADGVRAKGAALAAGMTRQTAAGLAGYISITNQYKSAVDTINTLMDGQKSRLSDLGQVYYDSNTFLQSYNEGLAVNTVEADAAAKAEEKLAGAKDKTSKAISNQMMVYKAFKTAGLSDNQARIITAEVGRENDYQSKYLFGGHNDPKNNKYNLGMISWQKERGKALNDHLKELGLIQNGQIVKTQEALNAQAMFALKEMTTNSRFDRTKKEFLSNPDVSYDKGTEVLGNNYIAWRYNDPKYASHHGKRDKYYNSLNAELGNDDTMKILQAENKAIEETLKRQQSIQVKYATAREKLDRDYVADITEIESLYAEGSLERTDLLNRAKTEYEEKRQAKAKSILETYMSDEVKLGYEHNKKIDAINAEFAHDDTTREMLIDLQKAAYQEDLANFKFASQAKAREQDKMYQSLANSMKANGLSAAGTGLDAMAQRTMSAEGYAGWRFGQDKDEAYNSVDNNYSNRQAEINAVDERGEFALPELERFELLEAAKQEHTDAMWAMDQEYALKQQTLDQQTADARTAIQANAFSAMTSVAAMFFGENSKMQRVAFAMEKAFAVQKALMTVKTTYSNTFDALSAIPLIGPYIAMPGAVAASAIQIAQAAGIGGMAAPSVSGIAHGGLDYVPKESTYLLDKGERVLSPRQNKDLANFMSNGQKSSAGNITINNNSSAQVSASQGPNGEVTIEMVDKMMDKRFRNIGRANSLESKAIQRGTTARVNRR
jgi:hypothetical protein